MSNTKQFLYVNRKAPYGTIYALESLEVVLIGAAFVLAGVLIGALLPTKTKAEAIEECKD